METLTLKQANKIIIEQINESNLFNRPEIDFILFNDREETSQTLIGVHEQDNPSLSYIYILETKDAIPMKDIKVYKKMILLLIFTIKILKAIFFYKLKMKK